MKKIFLLITFLTFVLVSCGDEPSSSSSSLEKQLIGEWDSGPSPYEVYHLIFNSDHTCRFWVVDMGNICCDYGFNWSVKGDLIFFTGNMWDLYKMDSEGIPQKSKFYFKNDRLYLPDADGGNGMDFRRVQ